MTLFKAQTASYCNSVPGTWNCACSLRSSGRSCAPHPPPSCLLRCIRLRHPPPPAHEARKPRYNLWQDSDAASVTLMSWARKTAPLRPTGTGKAHRPGAAADRIQRQSRVSLKPNRRATHLRRVRAPSCHGPGKLSVPGVLMVCRPSLVGERWLQILQHSSHRDVHSVSPPLQSGLASETSCPVWQRWPHGFRLGLSEP